MAKKKATTVDPRLARFLTLCDALPEAHHEPWGLGHHLFKVGKKSFAYYLNHHHGDGKVALCIKSTMPEQQRHIAESPKFFYPPAYMAHQAWLAMRVDLPRVDWKLAASLFVEAYRLQATKKILAQLDGEQ